MGVRRRSRGGRSRGAVAKTKALVKDKLIKAVKALESGVTASETYRRVVVVTWCSGTLRSWSPRLGARTDAPAEHSPGNRQKQCSRPPSRPTSAPTWHPRRRSPCAALGSRRRLDPQPQGMAPGDRIYVWRADREGGDQDPQVTPHAELAAQGAPAAPRPPGRPQAQGRRGVARSRPGVLHERRHSTGRLERAASVPKDRFPRGC